MSYSCSDFTDDVLELLVNRGLIKESAIPADDPLAQYVLVRKAIDKVAPKRS